MVVRLVNVISLYNPIEHRLVRDSSCSIRSPERYRVFLVPFLSKLPIASNEMMPSRSGPVYSACKCPAFRILINSVPGSYQDKGRKYTYPFESCSHLFELDMMLNRLFIFEAVFMKHSG